MLNTSKEISPSAPGLEHAPMALAVWLLRPSLDQIVMNNRLDRADVPSYAVELILYHEMLHVKHPLRAAACGLQAHSAEFRSEEKRFKHYDRARNSSNTSADSRFDVNRFW